MSPLPIKTGVIEPGSSGSIELSALECNKISAHYKLAESGMSHGGEFVWYKASYRMNAITRWFDSRAGRRLASEFR
jgi:hypothetical protein